MKKIPTLVGTGFPVTFMAGSILSLWQLLLTGLNTQISTALNINSDRHVPTTSEIRMLQQLDS